MKKLVSVTLAFTVTLLVFCTFSVSADASDFQVENGVLLRYSGNDAEVSVPEDVYAIADYAFADNTKLTSVDLNGVSIIGNKAFSGCKNLSEIKGSDHVSSSGAFAFENTAYLSGKSGNVILGSVLLKGASSETYTVPEGVKSIAPYCFLSDTKLKKVTIPDTVGEIGEGAFYGCSNLTSLVVSESVSYIGAFAFEGTKYLNDYNSDFVILGNSILVDYRGNASEVTIPDNVLQIGAGAFYKNNTIENVVIPEGISYIGMRAFAECSSLDQFSFPSSLAVVAKEAFADCTSLRKVLIPDTVEIVGESAFLGCTSLAQAEYFSACDIPAGLFAGCTSLASVYIASDLESIGDFAFYGCSYLREVSVPDSVRIVSTTCAEGAEKLTVYANKDSRGYAAFAAMNVKVTEIGDADSNGNLNIRDATFIQKASADMITMNLSNRLRADADFNGIVNVRDATKVQKVLAGF